MILFDPFFLFCLVETAAIFGLLFIWLDISFCYCYLALGGYITPEVYLHHLSLEHVQPAGMTCAIARSRHPCCDDDLKSVCLRLSQCPCEKDD